MPSTRAAVMLLLEEASVIRHLSRVLSVREVVGRTDPVQGIVVLTGLHFGGPI